MALPHGGKLVTRLVEQTIDNDFSTFEINPNLAEDIINIATGVFSPLEGFLTQNDLETVLDHKRLSNDTPWTIPILLDINKTELGNVNEGDTIKLTNQDYGLIATMDVEDLYTIDKKHVAESVYLTSDAAHPGVAMVNNMKDTIIGGKVTMHKRKEREFDDYNLSPKETRYLFKQKGWRDIVAFQTRNPPHIGHEYVQKTALTFVDGIFINPIIGKKKKGDFKDEVILKSYEALMKYYYLK
jgi:sulfate adenylyltransferase